MTTPIELTFSMPGDPKVCERRTFADAIHLGQYLADGKWQLMSRQFVGVVDGGTEYRLTWTKPCGRVQADYTIIDTTPTVIVGGEPYPLP